MRYTLWKIAAALVVASLLFAQAVLAKEASLSDRKALAREAAAFIQGGKTFAGLKSVKTGPAVIEGMWALAQWSSTDSKKRGQAGFYFACDHWNVGPVTAGTMPVKTLAAMWSFEQLSSAQKHARAAKMISELAALNGKTIAYLPPSPSKPGC